MNKQELVIIASGDSFFQGAESVDDIYFPNDFPGYVSYETARNLHKIDNRKKPWWLKRQALIKEVFRRGKYGEFISDEKKNSTIGFLSSHFKDTEVYNLGHGGASQQFIIQQAMELFLKLKNSNKINKKKVLFLIGYTYFTRYQMWKLREAYRENIEMGEWESDRVDEFSSWTDNKELDSLRNYRLLYYPDNALLNDWMMALLTIKSFALSVGADIIFLDQSNSGVMAKDRIKRLSSANINLCDILDLHLEDHLTCDIIDLASELSPTDDYYCLGGHWSRKTNEIGGKILADILTKKYNLV